jgi:hypothetical protein
MSWTERGMKKQRYPFVRESDSRQLRAISDIERLLSGRGNRVVVLIGPLNEHLMTEETRKTHDEFMGIIDWWFGPNPFGPKDPSVESAPPLLRHLRFGLLPSHLYADASHPLADGYRQLAAEMEESGILSKAQ